MNKHWLAHWHPFIIPLVLALTRIGVKAKLVEYQWSVFASDVCYFGVSFYVWALSARLADIAVCPPNRALAGEPERSYITIFLILNIVGSVLLYPMTKCQSPLTMFVWISLAFMSAVGSAIYLRARCFS
jgi:hypothetical protein